MTRTKGGRAPLRRKAIIKQAKGYFGTKSTHYKKANEQIMRSWAYAFRDRKKRKTLYRQIWIQRISAAVKPYGLNYSTFIHGLKLVKIDLDRKVLSELAIHENKIFAGLVKKVKTTLEKDKSKSVN